MATPSTHFNYTDVSLIKDGEGFEGEVLDMGPLTIRVLEDGRNTDNRIGSMILTIKGGSKGPPIHWHRMHDETFFVTKGKLRFTVIPADAAKTGSKETKDIDTKAGDYVIVPPKSIHTFSNPFEEEAEFFNTFTPAYYVDYLRMLAKAIGEAQKGGKMLTEAEQRDVMAQFATFSPGDVGVEL